MDHPVPVSPRKALTQQRYSSHQACTLNLRLGSLNTYRRVMDTVGSIMGDGEVDGYEGGHEIRL